MAAFTPNAERRLMVKVDQDPVGGLQRLFGAGTTAICAATGAFDGGIN
jgi:hypothetical protein